MRYSADKSANKSFRVCKKSQHTRYILQKFTSEKHLPIGLSKAASVGILNKEVAVFCSIAIDDSHKLIENVVIYYPQY